MYVLRRLVNYRNLRAKKIHISTALKHDEETLELEQGHNFLATAKAKIESLYEIATKIINSTPKTEKKASKAARECSPNAISSSLARKHNLNLTASIILNI